MKKLLYTALLLLSLGFWTGNSGCTSDEQTTWEKYADWRELNNNWLAELQTKKNPDGTPYYEVLIPQWNPGSFVLIHFFNDRSKTEGNLSPLYNSFADTRYMLHDCTGARLDSSVSINTTGVPGIYRSQVSSNIQGWAAGVCNMRCGDTAEIIVPYGLAYGSSQTTVVQPYSNLRFNVRLVDVPYYEIIP